MILCSMQWNLFGTFRTLSGCCLLTVCRGKVPFSIFGSLSSSCCRWGCGLSCWILVRSILLDNFEYSLDCCSTPAMMRSTTVGSSSIRIVVPTSMSRHFISYFFHSTQRYSTASCLGQEFSMVRHPSHDVLYCFLHLTCAAMELLMESLSFNTPSLSWNCLSEFADLLGSHSLCLSIMMLEFKQD